MPNKALPYLNFIALNVLRAWYTMVHQQEWGDHVPVPVCVSILCERHADSIKKYLYCTYADFLMV
jgi:hypothetical protein